jgi:myosin tail region-interacting protein MTI1
MSADDLMAQWGRVGVQICEVATTLYEKSRRSLIGDGTYAGFVAAVLREVPNATQPAPPYDTFGYVIYEQAGPSVHRRASEIMPGDVIVLQDAKLKGHKGLQSYHQHVGAAEPVCAVVADCEVKKTKVKVFQANQRVGQEVRSIPFSVAAFRFLTFCVERRVS